MQGQCGREGGGSVHEANLVAVEHAPPGALPLLQLRKHEAISVRIGRHHQAGAAVLRSGEGQLQRASALLRVRQFDGGEGGVWLHL
jgi:hypothetical protein